MNFQKAGIPIYKRRSIIEIGSWDLRGQNVPLPFTNWKTRKGGGSKLSLSSKAREPVTAVPEQERGDISGQEGTEDLPFFCLFTPFGLSKQNG